MFIPVKNMFIRDLGCSNVYGEINNCDVVGKRGSYDVIAEMKTSLNFKVILQAIERKDNGAFVYIAVPKPSKNNEHFRIYHNFLKPHGIGLIYVTDYQCSKDYHEKYDETGLEYNKYYASIQYEADFNRGYTKKRRKKGIRITDKIEEWEKNNIGGSKGGETVTSYSNMIDKVKKFLAENERSSIEEIVSGVEEVRIHYKNPKTSLTATLKEKWNKHWIEVERDVETKQRVYKLK